MVYILGVKKLDYENRSSEILERVLLALGIFMGAVIIGYNAFFVPGMNFSTVIQTSTTENIDEKSKGGKENIIEGSNVAEEKKEDLIVNESDDKVKENSNESKDSNTSTESKSNDNSKSSNKVNKTNTNNKSRININTATASELASGLKGVGEAIAKRIIDYRNKNGGFSSIEEIKKVKGIGDKIFENIKEYICV